MLEKLISVCLNCLDVSAELTGKISLTTEKFSMSTVTLSTTIVESDNSVIDSIRKILSENGILSNYAYDESKNGRYIKNDYILIRGKLVFIESDYHSQSPLICTIYCFHNANIVKIVGWHLGKGIVQDPDELFNFLKSNY